MKKYIIPLLFLYFFPSCVQNNGNIGLIFGKWQLSKVITPESQVSYPHIFYNFQNNIIETLHIIDQRDYVQAFGNFILNEDSLYINMKQNFNTDVDYQLPKQNCAFKIKQLTNNILVLSIEDKEWILKKY